MLKRKSFCVVCIANYCRSPVLENLLKSKYEDKYEFFSAGLSPIAKSTMDPRSLKYLKNLNIFPEIHNPKKVNLRMLEYFDFFLAVDVFVLYQLNKAYPTFKKKFKLVSAYTNNIDIMDPFKLDEVEYEKVMNLISYTSKKINLDDF